MALSLQQLKAEIIQEYLATLPVHEQAPLRRNLEKSQYDQNNLEHNPLLKSILAHAMAILKVRLEFTHAWQQMQLNNDPIELQSEQVKEDPNGGLLIATALPPHPTQTNVDDTDAAGLLAELERLFLKLKSLHTQYLHTISRHMHAFNELKIHHAGILTESIQMIVETTPLPNNATLNYGVLNDGLIANLNLHSTQHLTDMYPDLKNVPPLADETGEVDSMHARDCTRLFITVLGQISTATSTPIPVKARVAIAEKLQDSYNTIAGEFTDFHRKAASELNALSHGIRHHEQAMLNCFRRSPFDITPMMTCRGSSLSQAKDIPGWVK